ncbi:RNA polymerase sigma-70 factor [Sphingobacterium sp. JB170]|uniref:RNA polymerase sigma-70 factor n=1 Tax=Sphingobacterium sp. JB170 TaxID=1434842 RepID=UPI00097EF141|nr:RNA polymerase sigma-70 factor [Sphingobacterium sp. JB170]SJN22743.1 RNA polymerase ECF-type sigma factor [Sphingobacterium sp. JB170]
MDLRLFEHIYKQYADELLRYALSYRCGQRESEEIVQDVFLSLWERRNDLTVEGDIRQYLYKAVKYKVFDFFRKESRKQLLIDELRLQACDFQCFTEQEVSFNEIQKLIGHAVEKLPCRCREIYVMSRDQGLNNRDIAGKLSISEKTVEQHLTKALKYIRQKLGLAR